MIEGQCPANVLPAAIQLPQSQTRPRRRELVSLSVVGRAERRTCCLGIRPRVLTSGKPVFSQT